ncbi:amidohydrolase [Variovorax sp. J22P240]|uniref:amidohydrolase n=1 Tax=Variovorax sp. J22P240 TaxID=3053514 RepID=UPI002575DC47|nr:amidohydrolase [Variovorax sp. J22P240]MDM0000695.1 amidohydrolase [Variovorax sp. J22P240]
MKMKVLAGARSSHQLIANLMFGAVACATIAACGGGNSVPAMLPASVTPSESPVAADAVYTNAKVVTVDGNSTIAQAIAVKDGKFLRVGSNDEALQHRGSATTVVDLKGRTVIPGLTDSHFHDAGGGPGVDLSKTRSLSELFAKVTEGAAKAAPGAVVVSNADWHEAQLAEQRLPTAAELEVAAPGVPVALVRGGHSMFLNTTALIKFGITTSTQVPAGGAIPKDAQGNLTGELTDAAKALAPLPAPPAVTVADLAAQQKVLNSYGLTSVRMPGITLATYRQLQELRDTRQATVRYSVLFRIANASGISPLATAGVKPLEGDEWVKVWGIKLGVDGGFEGGRMTKAYLDPLGAGGTYFGLQTMTQTAFDDTVLALNKQGWRAAVHAVGDAAVDQVLSGFEKANADKDLTKAGWAIEHAFVTRPDQYPKMKAMNLRLSVQDHLYLAAPVLKGYWGLDRASQVTPLKTYMDQGFLLALGTDSSVVPLNPFWVMYHFLSRETISAGVYGSNEAVTSREAVLRMITLNNAKLTDEEAIKGSIEQGKLADFVVLSADYMTIPDKQVESLKAYATFVGGTLVYKDPEFSL